MQLDDQDLPIDGDAPIDMLESYCAAHGWPIERPGDDELVVRVRGSWGEIELRCLWRGDDDVLQLLALPDLRATADQAPVIHEAIGLVNEQLWLGHFERWSSTGIIVYRHAVLLTGSDGAALSLEAVEAIVETAIGECERFYPVFQFVLWGGKTPQEAIVAALIDIQGEA